MCQFSWRRRYQAFCLWQNLDAGAIHSPRADEKIGGPRGTWSRGDDAIEWHFGLRADKPDEFGV